jgi:NAD+ kinase
MPSVSPTLCIVVNALKRGSGPFCAEYSAIAQRAGWEVRSTEAYPIPLNFLKGATLCLVIGGDGSLLSTVSQAVQFEVPILGVNMGKLGFMTSFTPTECRQALPHILRAPLRTSERSLLECQCPNGPAVVALNDLVIKNTTTRLMRLSVFANGREVNQYAADGVIFSTPTGSTAYNLSAGGPLIDPSAPVLAMTPICPHTLSNRSVIFSDQTQIEVRLLDHGDGVQVSRDGQLCYDSPKDFPLRLRISPEARLKLLLNPDHAHFQLVHEKLGWGRDA